MRIAAWNVDTGANGGEADPMLRQPAKMEAAKKAIATLGAEVVILSDTSQWARIYGNRGLAEEMRPHGYNHAVCTDLEDESLKVDTGVAILSQLAINQSAIVRMEDRNGLVVTVTDPSSGKDIQAAAAYLHHEQAARRARQVAALEGQLDLTIPTVIAGDLNDVHPRHQEVRRLGGGATRFALRRMAGLARLNGSARPMLHQVGAIMTAINSMEESRALSHLMSKGFQDADVRHQPTAPTVFPFLQPDHILHSAGLRVIDFTVHRDRVFKAVSDHYPISAKLEVV